MRLRESMENIHHDGTISKLAIQFIKATKAKDETAQEELKGLMAGTFMAMGWDRKYTIQFIDALSAVTDFQDIEHLLSQYGVQQDDAERLDGIDEDAPFDPDIEYSMNITVPMVAKNMVKGEIGNLKNFLIKKGMKVKKIKLDRVNSYGDPAQGEEEESDPVVDLFVKVLVISKMDRDDIFNIVEPAYELEDLESMDAKAKRVKKAKKNGYRY